MPLQELDCPNCGAHLRDYKAGSRFACKYCGTTVVAPPKSGWAAPAVQLPAHMRSTVAQPPKYNGKLIALGVLLPMLMSAGIAGLTYFQSNAAADHASQQAQAIAQRMGLPGTPPVFDANGNLVPVERFGWDSVGGHPIPVQIKGAPAVVGRTRSYADEGTLYIDAYAAADGARLWRIDSGSTYSAAYRNIHVAVVGSFVVVSTLDATMHIHELESGERLRSATLTERVIDLCAPPVGSDASATVWVALADKTSLLLDPVEGTTKASKRPKWCTQTRNEGRSGRSRNASKVRKPKVKGMRIGTALVQGEFGIASGHKDPGTKIPRLVGFDPKSRKVTWQSDVSALDLGAVRMGTGNATALSGDRVAVVYGEGTEQWRFAGFDARDGSRLFDELMPSIFAVDRVEWMTAEDGYAYIERTGGLEIRSMNDGKLSAMIGTVTYDD